MAQEVTPDFIEAIVTCEGNLHDPDFSTKFQIIVDNLKNLLATDDSDNKEDLLHVRKIEPWNSVRVTISIPKEAAQRLKVLAQQGSNVLRQLGILSVQVEGDQVISLTLAGSNDETTQVILQHENNSDQLTPSTSSTSLFGNFILPNVNNTSVQQKHSPSVQIPGPSGVKFPSNSSSPFRSPNVIAPSGDGIPCLPQKTLPAGVSPRLPLAGPFPFASMAHAAAHTFQRNETNPNMTQVSGENLKTSIISNITATSGLNNTNSSASPTLLNSNVNVGNVYVIGKSTNIIQNTPTTQLNNVQQQTSNTVTGVILTPQSRIVESDGTRFIYGSNNLVNSSYNNNAISQANSIVLSSSSSLSSTQPSSAGANQSLQIQLVNTTNTTLPPPPYQHNQPKQHVTHQIRQQKPNLVSHAAGSSSDKPVSSPLLVNLLQHGDTNSSNSSSSTTSNLGPSRTQSSPNLQNQEQMAMPPPPLTMISSVENQQYLRRHQQLQEQRQEKLKRAMSLDSSNQRQLQSESNNNLLNELLPFPVSSQTPSTTTIYSTVSSSSNSSSEHFQFSMPLPCDVSNNGRSRIEQQPRMTTIIHQNRNVTPSTATTTTTYRVMNPTQIIAFHQQQQDQLIQMRTTSRQQQQHTQSTISQPSSFTQQQQSVSGQHQQIQTSNQQPILSQSSSQLFRTQQQHRPQPQAITNGPLQMPSASSPQQQCSSPVIAQINSPSFFVHPVSDNTLGTPIAITTTSSNNSLTQNQQFTAVTTAINNVGLYRSSSLPSNTNIATAVHVTKIPVQQAMNTLADQQKIHSLIPISTANINSATNTTTKQFIMPASTTTKSTSGFSHKPSVSVKPSVQTSGLGLPQNSSVLDRKVSVEKIPVALDDIVTSLPSQIPKLGSTSTLAPSTSTSVGTTNVFAPPVSLGSTNILLPPTPTSVVTVRSRGLHPGISLPHGVSGKPRLLLINPLTGHLEPMPSESSSDSDEDAHHSKNIGRRGLGKGKPVEALASGLANIMAKQQPTTISEQTKELKKQISLLQQQEQQLLLQQQQHRLQQQSGSISATSPSATPIGACVGRKLSTDDKPPTYTNTNVINTGEKIKLRLKLEKSEPIMSPAYKVDVSFLKKDEKHNNSSGTLLGNVSTGATFSAASNSSSSAALSQSSQISTANDPPRVPPLHISLRGKNAAVVVSPRRDEKEISTCAGASDNVPPLILTTMGKTWAEQSSNQIISTKTSESSKTSGLSDSYIETIVAVSSGCSSGKSRTKGRLKSADNDSNFKESKTKVSRTKHNASEMNSLEKELSKSNKYVARKVRAKSASFSSSSSSKIIPDGTQSSFTLANKAPKKLKKSRRKSEFSNMITTPDQPVKTPKASPQNVQVEERNVNINNENVTGTENCQLLQLLSDRVSESGTSLKHAETDSNIIDNMDLQTSQDADIIRETTVSQSSCDNINLPAIEDKLEKDSPDSFELKKPSATCPDEKVIPEKEDTRQLTETTTSDLEQKLDEGSLDTLEYKTSTNYENKATLSSSSSLITQTSVADSGDAELIDGTNNTQVQDVPEAEYISSKIVDNIVDDRSKLESEMVKSSADQKVLSVELLLPQSSGDLVSTNLESGEKNGQLLPSEAEISHVIPSTISHNPPSSIIENETELKQLQNQPPTTETLIDDNIKISGSVEPGSNIEVTQKIIDEASAPVETPIEELTHDLQITSNSSPKIEAEACEEILRIDTTTKASTKINFTDSRGPVLERGTQLNTVFEHESENSSKACSDLTASDLPVSSKLFTPNISSQINLSSRTIINRLTSEGTSGSGNTVATGEDSGIDSMDALSEKSPNQGESPVRKDIEHHCSSEKVNYYLPHYSTNHPRGAQERIHNCVELEPKKNSDNTSVAVSNSGKNSLEGGVISKTSQEAMDVSNMCDKVEKETSVPSVSDRSVNVNCSDEVKPLLELQMAVNQLEVNEDFQKPGSYQGGKPEIISTNLIPESVLENEPERKGVGNSEGISNLSSLPLGKPESTKFAPVSSDYFPTEPSTGAICNQDSLIQKEENNINPASKDLEEEKLLPREAVDENFESTSVNQKEDKKLNPNVESIRLNASENSVENLPKETSKGGIVPLETLQTEKSDDTIAVPNESLGESCIVKPIEVSESGIAENVELGVVKTTVEERSCKNEADLKADHKVVEVDNTTCEQITMNVDSESCDPKIASVEPQASSLPVVLSEESELEVAKITKENCELKLVESDNEKHASTIDVVHSTLEGLKQNTEKIEKESEQITTPASVENCEEGVIPGSSERCAEVIRVDSKEEALVVENSNEIHVENIVETVNEAILSVETPKSSTLIPECIDTIDKTGTLKPEASKEEKKQIPQLVEHDLSKLGLKTIISDLSGKQNSEEHISVKGNKNNTCTVESAEVKQSIPIILKPMPNLNSTSVTSVQGGSIPVSFLPRMESSVYRQRPLIRPHSQSSTVLLRPKLFDSTSRFGLGPRTPDLKVLPKLHPKPKDLQDLAQVYQPQESSDSGHNIGAQSQSTPTSVNLNFTRSGSIALPNMIQIARAQSSIPSNLIHSRISSPIISSGNSTVVSISLTQSPITTSTATTKATLFTIHPNAPSSLAQQIQQHTQQQSHPRVTVLPSGHKVVPIKLVTLPRQVQPINIGTQRGPTLSSSSPNLVQAMKHSAFRNVGPSNPVQSTGLNINTIQMGMSGSGNLTLVPISAMPSNIGHVQQNPVKLLVSSPLKMQPNLLKSVVVRSVTMENSTTSIPRTTSIRFIDPSPVSQSLDNLTTDHVSNVKEVVKHDEPYETTKNTSDTREEASEPVTIVEEKVNVSRAEGSPLPIKTPRLGCNSIYKGMQGVELLDTTLDDISDQDFQFKPDIIHDEKDLADALAAEGVDLIQNGVEDPITSAYDFTHNDYDLLPPQPRSSVLRQASVDLCTSKIENSPNTEIGTENEAELESSSENAIPNSPVRILRSNSPLYTYSNRSTVRNPKHSRDSSSRSPSPPLDVDGEDQEIIDSFSSSEAESRISTRFNRSEYSIKKKSFSIPDHSYNMVRVNTKSDDNDSLEELSIDIPAVDIVVNEVEERKTSIRSTRSNTRLPSPDITAFRADTPKSLRKIDLLSKNSPKASPTGSLKLLSPTVGGSSGTSSARASPISNSTSSTASSSAKLVTVKSGAKRKRQESDSSSASKDEIVNEDKLELIDLNSRPGKRRCSENAAELIKACIGIEDNPKRSNSFTKRNEELRGKEKSRRNASTILEQNEDEAESLDFGLLGRLGSRGSSEDRSSSRGSSVQRNPVSSKNAIRDDDHSGTKNNNKVGHKNSQSDLSRNSETTSSGSGPSGFVHINERSRSVARRSNRSAQSNTKNSGVTTKKKEAQSEDLADKHLSSTGATVNSRSENLRRKTRSSVAGGLGRDGSSSKRRRISKEAKS